VHDTLASSQGLFDRAMPYLTDGNDNSEMVRLAQTWIEQNPKDPNAHVRMGRVLLMLADSFPPDKKKQYIDRAKSEFGRAIELAPNDIRAWSASVILYAGSKDTRDQALLVLDKLEKQSTIDELQRDFTLAKLYDYLGKPAKAQSFYRQA